MAPSVPHASHAWRYWLSVIGLLASLVMGFVLLWLVPRWTNATSDQLQHRFWPALGLGIIAFIATPILAVVVSLTVIGLPVGLTLGGLYVLGLYLAHIVAGFWLGQVILRAFNWSKNRYLALILGLVILWLLRFIPVVGVIVGLVALILGLGGQVLAIWYQRHAVVTPAHKS